MNPEDDRPGLPANARGKDGRKLQIRESLAEAVRLIEEEGVSIKDAALAVGYARDSLALALTKPHVKAYRASVKRAWMQGRTSKAWRNVADLADNAKSEDVRLKANRTFIEAAGELGGAKDEGPRQQSLITIVAAPGSTVNVPSSGLVERPPIDVEFSVVEEDYAPDDID